jgi:hypothetical protein
MRAGGTNGLMSSESGPTCLNCGADLHGAFCSRCGQRALPPYPRLREMVGDAWEEVSGYDGRFARTIRVLLRNPGTLTVEVLEGRRARYVSPVRLYLVASVVYFLLAVAVPNVQPPPRAVLPGPSNITVDLTGGGAADLSPAERQAVVENIERAPWWIRPVIQAAVLDPRGFRAAFLERLPRVLFVLVPVFAAIVAGFYRRRPFSQHLVFALHLHAVAFIGLTLRELFNVTGSLAAVATARAAFAVFIAGYGLLAFRTVYREPWPATVVKGAGIALVYLLAGIAGLVVTLAWTALT